MERDFRLIGFVVRNLYITIRTETGERSCERGNGEETYVLRMSRKLRVEFTVGKRHQEGLEGTTKEKEDKGDGMKVSSS